MRYNDNRDYLPRSIDPNFLSMRVLADTRNGLRVLPNFTAGLRIVYKL